MQEREAEAWFYQLCWTGETVAFSLIFSFLLQDFFVCLLSRLQMFSQQHTWQMVALPLIIYQICWSNIFSNCFSLAEFGLFCDRHQILKSLLGNRAAGQRMTCWIGTFLFHELCKKIYLLRTKLLAWELNKQGVVCFCGKIWRRSLSLVGGFTFTWICTDPNRNFF